MFQTSGIVAITVTQSDGILMYSMSLLYQGLRHLSFRKAICTENGPAMMSHWRLNILDLLQNKHPKYLILAYHMLVG